MVGKKHFKRKARRIHRRKPRVGVLRYGGKPKKSNKFSLSYSRLPMYSPDGIMVPLKTHFLSSEKFTCHGEPNTQATAANIVQIRMNPGGDGRPYIYVGDNSAPVQKATTAFYNWAYYKTRYNFARPMGCKVTVKFNNVDETQANLNNAPLCFGVFPYVYTSTGSGFSNEWDETTTIPLTVENIGNLKYGQVKRLYGSGSNSHVTYSKYISFPKLVGDTYSQYLSDSLNYGYITTTGSSIPDPVRDFTLGILPADMIAGTGRSFNMEVWLTVYTRFESSRLSPLSS